MGKRKHLLVHGIFLYIPIHLPMIAISSDSHDVVHSQGHGAGYGPRPGALWGRDISMMSLTTRPKNRINIAKRV